MDMGMLQARITQMREAAAAISRSAARINDCIEAVDSEIKAIGTDRYANDSAEEFRREYNRLTPQLRESFDHLMRFHEKLNSSADEIEVAARPTG
jgi:uncharacterized protein YukE